MSGPTKPRVTPGLYDEPISRARAEALTTIAPELRVTRDLDPQHSHVALGRALHTLIANALASLPVEQRTSRQLALANRIVDVLRTESPDAGVETGDGFDLPAQALLAILRPAVAPATPIEPERPLISLSMSELLVNGPHDLSLGREVRKELASADRVDLLCSFLKWSGVRVVEGELRALRERGAKFRVLTTAYMMATERRALDALADMGAEIKVSYDADRTRLHAKAWMFHRDSGFTTGYVGSSNLSAAAMLDGAEWNVRFSAIDNKAILEKFVATFEQYWQDPTFRPYDAAEFDKFTQRSQRAALAPYLILDIEPREHQREMLEDLAAERAHGHMRNLVVAATGTGKTIVAALDYKRLTKELPRANLLFVAHRREILEQSLTTFRVALRDGAFGETLVAGERPDRWTHVFASVQSLTATKLDNIPRDHFDVVIVDEFHHAAARTYKELLTHLTPRVLLGLTATPERTDGTSVLHWFDGRIASELRLWKALDDGLLSPFQYFGIGGAPDVSGVKWSRGRYDTAALSNVYTADHLFALRVAQEVHRKVSDVSKMGALGFCVDVAHAEFMASAFTRAGIASAAVSGDSKATDRAECLAKLRSGELRCVFSVDLFNEGVDLPDVDTVLFLRPTESATVFLQQLGRGLRRSQNKECLTVLDFIGNASRRFRFDLRYRAIVGGTRRSIEHDIEHGFPSLPSGCVIQLDKQAQQTVLDNVRKQLGTGFQGLVEDLRALHARAGHPITLAMFLREAGVDLEDLYMGGRCWTTLQRAAGIALSPHGDDDDQIERGMCRMLHVDDPLRLDGIRAFVKRPTAPAADDTNAVQRILFMLLGYVRRPLSHLDKAWKALWQSPALRDEIVQLLDVLEDRARRVTSPFAGALAALPLRVHATYTLDEILAGVDERNSKGGVKRIQTGVYFCSRIKSDLLFVTLEKSEKEYSPTTLYNDYAISPTRFHWETQSNCHDGTDTGKRYLRASPTSPEQVVLFVRARRTDARGETMPYVCLATAFHHTHRGGRPMQIEWDLDTPMPASFYQVTKIAAG